MEPAPSNPVPTRAQLIHCGRARSLLIVEALEAPVSPHLSDDMKACIEACLACHEACTEASARLRMQGPGDAVQIGALLDCADLCRLAASLLTRDSPLHPMACALCAEACQRAARDCERLEDENLRQLAEVCRQTANWCRRMAAVPVAMM
jgi:hypothetical protein